MHRYRKRAHSLHEGVRRIQALTRMPDRVTEVP
jgi:hypothetical protein